MAREKCGTGNWDRSLRKKDPNQNYAAGSSYRNFHVLLLWRAWLRHEESQGRKSKEPIQCLMCEQRRVPNTRDFYRHVDTHLPNNLRRVRCAYENCQHTSSERENMDGHIRNVHTKAEYRCEMLLPLPDESTQDAAHVIPGRIYVCGFASTDAGAWSKHEKAHKQSGEDVKKKVPRSIDTETVWVVPSSQSCKVRCWNASRKWVPPPPPLVEYMAPQVHEVEPNDVTFPEGRFPNGLKHLEPFIPRPQRDLPRRCSSPPVTRSAPQVIQRSSRRVKVKAEPVNSDELYTELAAHNEESDEKLNRECASIERVSSPMSPPPAKETSTNAPARDLLCNRLLFSLSPAIFPTPTPSASPPPRSYRLRIRTPYLRPCSPSFGEGLTAHSEASDHVIDSDEQMDREYQNIERVSPPLLPPLAQETSTNSPARDPLRNRLLFSLSPAIFPTPTPSASPPPRSHRLQIRTPYLRPCSPSFGEGLTAHSEASDHAMDSDEQMDREYQNIERVPSPLSPPLAQETSTNSSARNNRLPFSLSPAVFPPPTPSTSPPPRSHRLRIRTPYLRPCSPSFGEGLE